MNQSATGKRGGRAAFTLVELLVVIAIIALLIAILLPVLSKVKRKAQQVGCASGEKQIYIAMTLFAADHRGHLPRPYFVGELSTDPVLLPLNGWSQQVSGASGHIDIDDNRGALWPYIKGRETRRKVLMCPGDEGEALAGHPVMLAWPRNVSYSFNQHLYRDPMNGGRPSLGVVMASVKESSQRILIYEELAPNDSWCIMGYSGDDVPSGRHSTNMNQAFRNQPNTTQYKTMGRGNHCFFDGHVESLSTAQLLPPSQGGQVGSEHYHTPLVKGDPTVW